MSEALELANSFSQFPRIEKHDSVAASEGAMRPKKQETTGSADLFRARLDQIINMRHELVQLAGKIDWEFIDGEIAPLYSDGGRPGIATQFVIGLFFSSIFTDCPTKACANAESMIHTSGTSLERRFNDSMKALSVGLPGRRSRA